MKLDNIIAACIAAVFGLGIAVSSCTDINPVLKPVDGDDTTHVTPGPDTAHVNPGPDTTVTPPGPGPDTTIVPPGPDTTVVVPAVTATLTYAEAKDCIGGYGNPKTYTNDFGTWTICAYKNSSNMQINSGKVSYIGTPVFEYDITRVVVTFDQSYTDDIYLCSECGTTQVAGKIAQGKASGQTCDIDLTVSAKQVFIRSAQCARISAISVVYGGKAEEGGGEEGGGEEGGGDTPVKGTGTLTYYEVPLMHDTNNDGIDDNDPNLVYAHHTFKMNGRVYRNYTVCYNIDYHCPVWVAAPRHAVYSADNVSRSDAYQSDPIVEKIAPGTQYTTKKTGDESGCNKGHMLGSNERTCCTEANKQVFYYTNIAPQYSTGFNTGGAGWNTIEDFMDGHEVSDTLYEVVGCYFENYTDGNKLSGTPKRVYYCGLDDVMRPSMFYMVVLRTKKGNSGKALKNCTASEMQCVAFVRAHNNNYKSWLDGKSRPKVFASDMMSVSDLEKITGFTYFPNVPNAPKDTYNPSDWL
ncbi:MAG: DNA/RNA non-specific endonuclease [Bacteroidales bacterium]|nr:DNA/RNA non-specific endonuclease [Candidatus Cryptobacteroides aphodequi]